MDTTQKTLHLENIKEYLNESAEVKRLVAQKQSATILLAAGLLVDSFKNGNKLLLCGNGGSAADCQHLAAEFVNRLSSNFERQGLPAMALTTDTSFLTAFINDYNFDDVFKRQFETFGKPGDVMLGITTSGQSINILKALDAAKQQEMKTIALLGQGGEAVGKADVSIIVSSDKTQYMQEAHLAIEHILCSLVERILYGKH